ncbi:hypothetical protein CDO51_07570 [Natranaerobius trueperi]|uniref:Transposase IS4-like domain-containing protein n=1 Tax=Natranaerobius trueperi TaxID=759412 RepID=A0A226BXN3_9FIRM|nr:hypothetical protein CDO51_07570 [Natranaerobius trueperi]
MFNNIKELVKKLEIVVVDAGYKTPTITNFLLEEDVHLVMPYKRPQTPNGYFRIIGYDDISKGTRYCTQDH